MNSEDEVRDTIRAALIQHAGKEVDRKTLISAVSRALLARAPDGMSVEVVEMSPEEKVVREIMEEPDDSVRVNVTLPYTMKYINMTFTVDEV